MLEERKRMRATAKETRLQDQAQKKAQRAEAKVARQADQQLKNNLKQAKKGKKKTITPVVVDEEDIVEVQSLIEDEVPVSRQSRLGRQILPPQRYRT